MTIKFEQEGYQDRWTLGRFSFERRRQRGWTVRDHCEDYIQGFRNAHWKIQLRWFVPSLFVDEGKLYLGVNLPFWETFWLAAKFKTTP